MKKPITVETRNILAGLLLGLLSALRAVAGDLNVPANYATIQAAVDAASSGDTIHIAPGIYVGQVMIIRKNLTLLGAPGAVLRAIAGMPATLSAYGFGDMVPVLGTALSDVVVKGVTFEGEHLAEAFPVASYCAIGFSGSSGRIEDCTVRGFRNANAPFDLLNAPGICVANNRTLNTPIKDVQIRHCAFADNADSIMVNGNYGTYVNGFPGNYMSDQRLTFTIEDNVIDGDGPMVGTQVGILIAPGVTGDVRHNRISVHYNTQVGADISYSCGIWAVDWLMLIGDHPNLAAQLPVRYEGNTFVSNQLHLASTLQHGSQFLNNTFQGSGGTNSRLGGLALSGNTNQVIGNRFLDMATGITLVGNDPSFGTNFGIATNPMLISNRFCNVPMPIVIQPFVTGVTNMGTLVCPFPPPTLAIAPAVILSWPAYTDGWILESAPTVDGPWAGMGQTPTLQGDQNTVSVATDSSHRFFRLRSP